MPAKANNYGECRYRVHPFLFLGKSAHDHAGMGAHDQTRISAHDAQE